VQVTFSSAPSARVIHISSRKGRKGAKDAKGREGGVICYLCLLITRYAHLQNPFLFFLCELGVLCAFARGIAEKPRRRRRRSLQKKGLDKSLNLRHCTQCLYSVICVLLLEEKNRRWRYGRRKEDKDH